MLFLLMENHRKGIACLVCDKARNMVSLMVVRKELVKSTITEHKIQFYLGYDQRSPRSLSKEK